MVARIRAALEALLEQHEGNQSALARQLGVSATSVGSWFKEGGNGPSFETAQAVAEALQIDVFDLLSGARTPPQALVDDFEARAAVRRRAWYLDEPAEVRAKFEAIRYDGAEHLDPHDWLKILQRLSLAHALGSLDTPLTSASAERTDRDEKTPRRRDR
jgi:transcriptional regulator with XRE-family HTH domain